MSRRGLLVVVCCACALGVAPSSANAASVTHQTCTAPMSWSVGSTSATWTATNVTCYQEDAAVTLDGLFPEWNVRGQGTANDPGPYSGTLNYNPIVGQCLGTLALENSTSSTTGVLKNEGNFNSVAKFVTTSKQNPQTVVTVTTVGALQNACSPSWNGGAVFDIAIVAP